MTWVKKYEYIVKRKDRLPDLLQFSSMGIQIFTFSNQK